MKNLLSVLAFLIGGMISTQAQQACVDTVYIHLTDAISVNDVSIDVEVENFDLIAGMQFTVKYDPAILDFVNIVNVDLPNPGNFNSTIDGELRFLWIGQTGQGEDLPDGSVIFRINFQALSGGTTSVYIDDDPLDIEITAIDNGNVVLRCLGYTSGNVSTEGAFLSGYLTAFEGYDCIATPNTIPMQDWIIQIEGGGKTYTVDTKADGYWSKLVEPGTHIVSLIPINAIWDACVNDVELVTMNIGDTATVDFTAAKTIDCTDLTVGLSTPFLRRCFDNTYTVAYCNQGTIPATDASIEIELDDDLIFVSCSNPNYTISGQILTVDVGDLEVLECGTFTFVINVDCMATFGATHCVKAEINPHDPCIPPPSWNGASIDVVGTCDGDSVRFTIQNNTTNDMIFPSAFIVVEDDVMMEGTPFSLNGLEYLELAYEANGSTYRVNADQVMDHPGFSMPTLAVEGCGTNNTGQISLGYVNMFPENDADGFVAIDCQQNIGSYDPNDKAAQPVGYRMEHYIKKNTDIEYKIRFQNTGTDTAFRVVVVDELSENLDMRTIHTNASSHPFEMNINDRIVSFTFDNILLPDSTVNEPASHGFVSFKISQILDLADGEVIENNADIFFDYNDPILTNTVTHTIGTDFVEEVSGVIDNLFPLQKLTVMPHPVVNESLLSLGGDQWQESQITIYDAMGRVHFDVPMNQEIRITKHQFPEGIYMYRVQQQGQIISIGKLIVQ